MTQTTKTSSKFTLQRLAKTIVLRQKMKNASTIVYIYGPQGSGKSTLMLRLIRYFVMLKRREFLRGESEWDVPKRWSKILQDHFAADVDELVNMLMNKSKDTFGAVDEGTDVMSWVDQMSEKARNMTKQLQKIRFRKLFCPILIPHIGLFQKNLLSLGHYMIIIPEEINSSKKCNYALVLKNHKNQIAREKNPFGLNEILKKVEKNPMLANDKNFEKMISKSPCYVTKITFRPLEPEFYALYEKIVKEPQWYKQEEQVRKVPYGKFKKLEYVLNTLLYNLHIRDGKNFSQIARLTIDRFGTPMMNPGYISKNVNRMISMEIRPDITEDDIFAEDSKEPEKEEYSGPDIEVEDDIGDSRS